MCIRDRGIPITALLKWGRNERSPNGIGFYIHRNKTIEKDEVNGLIPKETVQRVLQAALREGADFAELYYENTQRNSLQYRDGKVETVLSGLDAGAGIRVFSGTNSAYAYTCDISAQALADAAVSAARTLRAHAKEMCIRDRCWFFPWRKTVLS